MTFDPNLGSAAVYAIVACIYLRREHTPLCRIILFLAAMMLAFCAAAKSDTVHRWHQPEHALMLAEDLTPRVAVSI